MAKSRKSFRRKKKTYRRRNKKNVINRTMVSLGEGFPKRLTVTHKYMDNIALTSAGGVLTYWNYSANSLTVPNITAAGAGSAHQPMYFDQVATLYNHYVVIGARIKCTFMPTLSTTLPMCFGIFLNDDAAIVATDFNNLAENSKVKLNFTSHANNQPKTVHLNWSAKKTFGGSVLSNADLIGTTAVSPVERSNFTLFAQTIDRVTAATLYVQTEIEYIAVWKELKDIASS